MVKDIKPKKINVIDKRKRDKVGGPVTPEEIDLRADALLEEWDKLPVSMEAKAGMLVRSLINLAARGGMSSFSSTVPGPDDKVAAGVYVVISTPHCQELDEQWHLLSDKWHDEDEAKKEAAALVAPEAETPDSPADVVEPS